MARFMAEVESAHPLLPALRRAEALPERILYVARAGLGALPSGFFTVLVFISPQIFALLFFVWAIWWPYPASDQAFWRAVACTAVLASILAGVAWALARRYRGFVTGVMTAPFIRITVTDRRVLWTVPWSGEPLIEIGRQRIIRSVLGGVDRRGRGHAAIELVPGDPAADIDGHVHFDRLPRAEDFVRAFATT